MAERTRGRKPRERGLPRGPQALPREQVAADQRERLYEATIKSVDERGFVATTISDLVANAGVSRRSFYEHFAEQGGVPDRHLRRADRAAHRTDRRGVRPEGGVDRADRVDRASAVRRLQRPPRRGAAGVCGDGRRGTGGDRALGTQRRAARALLHVRVRTGTWAWERARAGRKGDRGRTAHDPLLALAPRTLEQVAENRTAEADPRRGDVDRGVLPDARGHP